ncbi:MAG TPA: 2-phospho-L-lactate guanylyltransferase [Candidatus Dormibacteraeota bacterium]|nr:2-phospho-L-lactate guanylyltransferase [Candidatus Dormibacteraeota bacterium]
MTTRVVLLVKDFDLAKSRLSSVLDAAGRRVAAVDFARTALDAVGTGALVVAGSDNAARLAGEAGNEVVLEERAAGQNPAAALGIAEAGRRGAEAVLVLSSDLPLVRPDVIERLLAHADALARPVVVAAPATGRGGTNALYLAPPDAIGLHFGDDSLAKFEADARARGVRFELYESEELALDVDEPSDLDALRVRRRAG